MPIAHGFADLAGRMPSLIARVADGSGSGGGQAARGGEALSVTLADVQAAFDMAGTAVREDDPRADAIQARALRLFQQFNLQHHRAIKTAAKTQIDVINDKLPAVAEGEVRELLEAKLRLWEAMLLDAASALARADLEGRSGAAGRKGDRAA